MAEYLSSLDSTCATRLQEIASAKNAQQFGGAGDTTNCCEETVATIISRIEKNGDSAVRFFAEKWDGIVASTGTPQIEGSQILPLSLRLPNSEIERAAKMATSDELRALRIAARRIRTFHKQQGRQHGLAHYSLRERNGMRLDSRVKAISDVGLYVPGGHNSYPSSLLMTGIPARIAGVKRIAVATPLSQRNLSPLLAATLQLLEIDEVYPIGGAQAIAALALGTETIKAVDLIVGPGNAWVNAAKRQLFGRVGIDTIAGPSEVLIIADNTASPAWVAADLLAQAEHDMLANSILISDNENLIAGVNQSINKQLPLLPRKAIAEKSWYQNGLCLLVENLLNEAPTIIDLFAPEHVQIVARGARKIAKQINNAGAIFIGAYAPEALGDYIAGPNHVLPTARNARFASGLGVENFTKRTNIIEATDVACRALAPHAITLARAEGLEGHARSLQMRQLKSSESLCKKFSKRGNPARNE